MFVSNSNGRVKMVSGVQMDERVQEAMDKEEETLWSFW